MLADCDAEFKQFIEVMDVLGDKLGPLLLQFGYFNKKAFVGVNDFLARLRPFLKKLPKGHKFAVEIRNKNWLQPLARIHRNRQPPPSSRCIESARTQRARAGALPVRASDTTLRLEHSVLVQAPCLFALPIQP